MTLLTFANIFGCSGCYNISAFIATLRANVYHVVCALYDVHIVLDYDYCMSMCDEPFKRVHQRMYVVEMKPGGGFVEYKERGHRAFLPKVVGQFDALVFATRQSRT